MDRRAPQRHELNLLPMMNLVSLLIPLLLTWRVDGGVPDLGDRAREVSIWKGVDTDGRAIAERNLRHLGLIDLHDHFNHRKVRDGRYQGAGVVHRTNDHGLTFLDVQAGDLPSHRA